MKRTREQFLAMALTGAVSAICLGFVTGCEVSPREAGADDGGGSASMANGDDGSSGGTTFGFKPDLRMAYPDLRMGRGRDLAIAPGARPDLAMNHPPPGGGAVGPNGGAVTLLHFGVVGDTRPAACEDTAGYPTGVINAVADQFRARAAQFVVDLGDHMYVCNDSLQTANAQMDLYMAATQRYGDTWFMTEGNHECWKGPCLPGSTNANYVSFLTALNRPLPYYSVEVQTSLGLAVFVFVADNSWDANQAAWLERTLASADVRATYTIVLRHHPEGDVTVATNADSVRILRNHKFALFLTGHEHLYKHMATDRGRDVVIGNGGAPLIAGGAFNGYAMIDQDRAGKLTVSVYDVSNNFAPVDTFSVGPN